MKLLVDHNLSPKLVKRLADVYPFSQHVSEVGMADVLDKVVWEHARQHNFIEATVLQR